MFSRKNGKKEKEKKKKRNRGSCALRKKVGRKAGRVGWAEREGPAGLLVMTQKGVCAAALPGGQHESWACLGKILVA